MGQRILVLLTTLTTLFVTPVVLALGLGEVNLQSGLNQPLKAQIQLLQVRGLTKNEILVGLGSPEDFNRIGVDRPYFLSDLKFEVDLDNPAGPVINISSHKAVREPYLNFIVQAQWPSGKLLREYTLLLDLPVFSDSSGSSVQGVQTVTSFSGAPTQQPSYEPKPPPTSRPTESADGRYNPRSSFVPEGSFNEQRPASTDSGTRQTTSAPPPRLAGADEYSVNGGDTLWEIAAAVRPDRDVSIQQTMLAIQRMNPEAFINNNINLLKKGQILRIPNRDEIAQMSRQAALREVAIQNSAWSGGEAYSYGSSEAQLEGSSAYSSRESATTTREGRLKLASPEDASDAREGRGTGSGDSSEAVLENELAITLEELDKTERDNSELRSKIDSLEDQIETQERLVEITSDELRQAELAMEKNAQEREAGEEAAGEQAATETEESATSTETPTEQVATETTAPAEDPKTEQQPESDVPKVVQPIYEKTFVDHILDNIIYILIGLLVVVVLGFLFIRSRSSDGFDDEDFMAETSYDKPKSEFDVDAALAEEAENLDDFDESPVFEEAAEEDEHISEAQTEDVVAEADIYIAYGKYDQAEEILLKSLQQDPDNKDARLKLVEVYAALQDGDKFDEHFAILHQIGDEDAIGRAEQLRSGIAGLDVFDPGSSGATLEDDTTVFHARQAREEAAESAEDDSMDFSLDLDMGDSDSGDSTADELALNLDEKDSDLDFDLGDFDVDIEDDDTTVTADSDDDFSLDLDDDSSTSDDGLDFDLGDSSDGDDLDSDDLAIDLDSGEDLDGRFDLDETSESDLIEDNLEEDVEPLDFDLSMGDTEVGSTPAISNDDMSDLEFELDSGDSSDADFDGDFGQKSVAAEEEDDFDLELSDEAIEDLDDMPDLSLDDVSDDDLDPITGTGSEDLTLISPAVTDADLADSARDDELSVEGDLDLSALDQELDALTGTRGGSDYDDLESGLDSSSEAEALPTMEEPVIDFDGLDEDLDEESTLVHGTRPETEMGEDTMFDQAVNEVPSSDMEFDLPEIDPEMDDDTDLGFLSDSDETATKLDLARAYIDMGDAEGAKDIIGEIMKEGNEQQRQEAQVLLKKLS